MCVLLAAPYILGASAGDPPGGSSQLKATALAAHAAPVRGLAEVAVARRRSCTLTRIRSTACSISCGASCSARRMTCAWSAKDAQRIHWVPVLPSALSFLYRKHTRENLRCGAQCKNWSIEFLMHRKPYVSSLQPCNACRLPNSTRCDRPSACRRACICCSMRASHRLSPKQST